MMEQYLFGLIVRYGARILFLAQAFGIIGLPIPDELLLTLAGSLVRRGDLSAWNTVVAAIAGSVVGALLSFTVGRLIAGRALRQLPFIQGDMIARAQSWLERHGTWMLALGYFVPGVRHLTGIVAGSLRLSLREFCTYVLPGASMWSITFLALGYYAGTEAHWERFAFLIHAHLVLAATLLAAVVGVWAHARRRAHHEVTVGGRTGGC